MFLTRLERMTDDELHRRAEHHAATGEWFVRRHDPYTAQKFAALAAVYSAEIDRRLECELARCEREIAGMRAQRPGAPAYLTTLGIQDWEAEKRLILRERRNGAL